MRRIRNAVELNARPGSDTIVIGFLGSVLVLLGSVGVGWAGPFSWLWTWTPAHWGRTDTVGSIAFGACAVIGATLLVTAWLRLGLLLQAQDERGARALGLRAGAVWAAPLLFTVPMYSRDIYAYVAQGRMLGLHLNPYAVGYGAVDGWQATGSDPLWADSLVPYGPVGLALSTAANWMSGGNAAIAVLLLRAMAVLALVALVHFGEKLARERSVDVRSFHQHVTCSPLLLLVMVIGAHNDIIMLALVVAAVLLAVRGKPWWALVVVALAVGVKPTAVVAVPVIGLLWAGRHRTMRRLLGCWAIAGAVTAGIVAALGVCLGVGLGWIGALATPGVISHWYAPANWVSSILKVVLAAGGMTHEHAVSAAKLILFAITIVLVCWALFTRRVQDDLDRLPLVFGALVISSPFIHPWYVCWVVATAAVVRTPVALRWGMTIAAVFFTWVLIFDNAQVAPDLQSAPGTGSPFPLGVRGGLTIIVGLVFVAALIRTRRTAIRDRASRTPVPSPTPRP